MKVGFRRLLHKRGVGGIKNSQKMKFAFFDCFYVMLPLKKGVHYKEYIDKSVPSSVGFDSEARI